MAGPSQRSALGVLFLFLAACFAGIALASFAGGLEASRLVVGFAAAALGVWLASLALRALRGG